MILELAVAATFLAGSYIYHRLTDPGPKRERGRVDLPITEEGAPQPYLFGRCRVTTPVLAWMGPVAFETRGGIFRDLRANMFFVLGRGFEHGDGINTPVATNHVHAIYAGDYKKTGGLDGNAPPGGRELSQLTGNGNFEDPVHGLSFTESDQGIVGDVEFLNGGPAQILVNAGATTYAGTMMTSSSPHGDQQPEARITGYRGVLSVCMFQGALAGGFNHGRVLGPSPYQFEASSYATNHPSWLTNYCTVGDDSNPINVIYEILTSPHLLGLPASMIDIPSFQGAQYTLMTETHGYSRFWNQRTRAGDMLDDVLRQIDGLLYFEHRTGKICVRLVRADYVTADLFTIDKTNGVKITGFAMGGRTNVINKVRVVYLDRAADYNEKAATAQDMANAVGQDGQVSEEQIEYLGCTMAALAQKLAERELEARSKPMVKFSIVVKRSALRLTIGDVVRVVWTNPDINAAFRIVGVDRGTLEDGAIRLDLVSEVGYVWRNHSPLPPGFGGSGLIDPPVQGLGGLS